MLTNRQLLQELRQKQNQLAQFRHAAGSSLQTRLDEHDWGLVTGAGHGGLPLLTLRLHHRIALNDPFLIDLAEKAEQTYGPVDFAIFSGETETPLRVLSRTLLDTRWRWRQSGRTS